MPAYSVEKTTQKNTNLFLNELVNLSPFETNTNDTPIFIDIGDHHGYHGIYAATIGYKTWIKEEEEINLMQV